MTDPQEIGYHLYNQSFLLFTLTIIGLGRPIRSFLLSLTYFTRVYEHFNYVFIGNR